ncbi:SgcJ/EcaC family oxidoreductase [Myxococcus stipitatus]|uniref:SgcJ/EcaC family oxidoreductase n=1 Tax=Myxococcus stipitatus TaxID=83455 RepID=UPI001F1E7FF9|nr:SgcJ/EcaC family oxidoreductase [Myxococcus stipitatus]MCE9669297.1 SgcJ/EcaC family oxidoreductase [Myxococcus stipitatus]
MALAFPLPCVGCAHVDRSRDEATIREQVDAQTAAWNRQDAVAWSQDFTRDADFINIVGMLLEGHEQIESRHAAVFASIFKGSQSKVTVRRLSFTTDDVAVVDTVHEVTGFNGLPPGVQPTEPGLLRTQMRYVMKRVDGKWRIVAGQNTDVKPRP